MVLLLSGAELIAQTKEGSISFLKKRNKKLLLVQVPVTPTAF
jgi:hypothetical protein